MIAAIEEMDDRFGGQMLDCEKIFSVGTGKIYSVRLGSLNVKSFSG